MNTKPSYEQLVEEARLTKTPLVRVDEADGVAVVTMSDPTNRNALGAALTLQLRDTLERLAADPAVRAIVLTGDGGAFSAGGDLRAMAEKVWPIVDESDEGAVAMWRWIRRHFGSIVRTIVGTDKPFIAAVGGPAAGVGLAFAMACDLIVASTSAQLVIAFGKIGLVPEVGLSWLLTRRLGYQKTFECYVSGAPIDAATAERLGLVNQVVPPGEEITCAREWAKRAMALSAPALAMTKPLLRAVGNMTFNDALVLEEFAEPMCFTTQAHRDGVRALLARSARSNR